MSQHAKRRVKQRSKAHQKLVKAGHRMRKRRGARGVTTAAKRHRTRAARVGLRRRTAR